MRQQRPPRAAPPRSAWIFPQKWSRKRAAGILKLNSRKAMLNGLHFRIRASTLGLWAAGFVSFAVVRVPQIWHLHSPETLFDVMYNGSVRNAALLRAQKPDALEAIRAEIRQMVAQRHHELAMPAVLASAEK